MTKITIIGAGSVGSTIAYTLAVDGICSEIVMIDINGEKALGEALDIRQGLPFCSPCTIYAGTYRDAYDSDIVIITSGIARKPGQTRLDLAQTNVDIIKGIIPQITAYAPEATYVIVSNPVDILTYVWCKCSDISENKIIGSGTILDTSRLRARISEYYTINQQNVHAYVFGEHGDSSFVPWSLANISNIPVDKYHDVISSPNNIYPAIDHDEIETYIKKSGKTFSTEDEILAEVASDVHVEEKTIQRDEAMRIRRELHKIPEPYKEVFMWRVFAEMSFKQIGAVFGKTENWACVTYHRAKNMIKTRMEAEDRDE